MKGIVFLEDRPNKLRAVINELNGRQEVEVKKVLYYSPDLEDKSAEVEKVSAELGVSVQTVNMFNFDEIMDDLYSDEQNLFIFDTQITQESIEVFSYMINVNYALKKKKKLQGEERQRIWFYTVAGAQYMDNIRELFPDQVISATVDNDILQLQFDQNTNFCNALAEE